MKIEKKKNSSAFEAYKSLVGYNNAQDWGLDSRAVSSIQEHYSCDFSIPQLFLICSGRKLCGRKYLWDC